jgi:hypothetical protein
MESWIFLLPVQSRLSSKLLPEKHLSDTDLECIAGEE